MTTKEKILEMMRITREMTIALVSSAMPALASASLTREEAEAMVDVSVRFLTGVGHLYQALEEAQKEGDLDPAVYEAAAEFADLSQEFGMTLQTRAIDQVKRLGGNANRFLYDAEKRHS